MSSLALWAGLECTINRVQDRFFSQCEKNGHFLRKGDLESFAKLNVQKIRYPCLWESVAQQEEGVYDWRNLDKKLKEFQDLQLIPVVGLLHHGNGPSFTCLTDPQFPEKFARFARDFAQRFPWVEDYIPIDEILTTARFSCLYGHWYPHHRNDASFVRALFNQVKGSILAMREIRKLNPNAQFIHVDDIGRAQGTEPLAYQVEFENHRRWLSFDLLCGKVTSSHPLYRYLVDSGLAEEELLWLQNNICVPDVLGLNHYLLSNRFLDHRLDLYPVCFHGGNHRERYADLGVADLKDLPIIEPEEIFKEVWDRYKIPLAITEVHVRGHREDQMRWLYQIWQCALRLREQGVDVKAVTAWSLLGNYDWHNLCTVSENFYEPGVFDLRSQDGSLRQTALTRMINSLATTKEYCHPVLANPGWWKINRPPLFLQKNGSSSPLVITGGAGTLGQAFARICEKRGLNFLLLQREDMDITELVSVFKTLDAIKPWAIVNTAGYVKVDQAEIEKERCFKVNSIGVGLLAQYCAETKIPFLTFSSDLVFNGQHDEAYLESHLPAPINTYGLSKAEGETKVLGIYPEALVVRTSSFFGPWDHFNFATRVLKELSFKREVFLANDIKISPTYIPDLVHTCLDLLIDGEQGLLHLANEGSLTWAEFGHSVVRNSGSRNISVDGNLIIEKSLDELNFLAPRPRNSVLSSEKMKVMPPFEDAVNRYFAELEIGF